jgi:hypothetical protein
MPMTRRSLVAALIAATLLPSLAFAQAGDAPPPRKRWRDLTPEERKEARQRARERQRNMTPEQREAARQRRRERFEKLPPEQQERIRQRQLARRQQRLGEQPPVSSPAPAPAPQ